MKSNGIFRKFISGHKNLLCYTVNVASVLITLAVFWFSKTLEDYDKAMKISIAVFAVDMFVSLSVIIIDDARISCSA